MNFDIAEWLDRLPPLNIPGLQSTDCIGIDLGTYSIKLVQVHIKNGGKPQLVRWSYLPLSVDESDKTDLSPEEKKANATYLLRTYRGSGKNIPKNVATSVSGNSVIVRYVKLPKMSIKDLSKKIKQEAEPFIPFNIEEVFLGFYPLRDLKEDGKDKIETVLVAAKKDFVSQKIEILEEAGFKPAIMDVDAFALETLYEKCLEKKSEETVLWVNFGHSKTNFLILERGITMMVKDSPISGNSINRMILKNLLSYNKAIEKLKSTSGLLLTAEEKDSAFKEAIAVSDSLLTVLKDFISEAKKIIQYYMTQGKDRKVDRILLSGGIANTKNLVSHLSAELGMSVVVLDPFQQMEGAQGIPEDIRSTFAVAAGLSLRRTRDL